jgi:spore cortex biosynthesis protein YabQ
MSELVNSQAHVFLFSVAGGAVIAFVYDIFRIYRKTVKTVNTLTYLQDMLFWILVAVIMFVMVYISNEGELRGYILFGAVLGAILYLLLFSSFIMRVTIFIIKIITKTVRLIVSAIIFPFKLIIKFLSIPAAATGRYSVKAARGVRRILRNRFSKAALYGKILKNAGKKI